MSIFSLPREVLYIILEDISCQDILNFGLTCTEFNRYVKSNQSLWRLKTNTTLSPAIAQVIGQHCNGDWLSDLQYYNYLKKHIYLEVSQMSPEFYWRVNKIHLGDVRKMFQIATSKDVNYFFTTFILIELYNKGCTFVHPQRKAIKPYTLTEMYYTKITLRYLIHTYQLIKWQQLHCVHQLFPENVLNFFLQWLDTTNLHLDENMQKVIDELVSKVEDLLEDSHPLKLVSQSEKERWSKEFLTGNKWDPLVCRQVLHAVTQVIFHKHMAITAELNLNTLDIKKISVNNFSNAITILVLYEAVARRCGIRCDLIAFPEHLFLEWKETYEPMARTPTYLVNHATGELELKRSCPYAEREVEHKYSPKLLLQYFHATFNKNMGEIRDWTTENALHMLNIFANNATVMYRNIVNSLSEIPPDARSLQTPMNFKIMEPMHLDMIMSLVDSNKDWDKTCSKVQVKRHDSRVKFAVGMLCYHRKYHYVCIIRGWDATCMASIEWQLRMSVITLKHGAKQPYYTVTSVDCSDRYVAQENLQELPEPRRLHHLEEVIAREFSHFDDYCYVPNEEKEAEYPDDEPVRRIYRNRYLFARSTSQDRGGDVY